MCNAAAIGAAAGVGKNYLQYRASKERSQFQTSIYERTSELSRRSSNLQQDALVQRAAEARRATAQEVEAVAVEAMKRRSTLSVAAIESGLGGESVEALDRDFTAAELNRGFGLELNLEALELQLERDAKGFRLRQEAADVAAHSRIAPTPSTIEPFLGGAMVVGGAQADAPQGTFLGFG